jgi:secreted PhoX family phosphatase
MLTSRRGVLAASAAGLAFAGFGRLAGGGSATAQTLDPAAYRSEVAGYGPLREDPARLFDLPDGFSYTILSQAGAPMSDGFLTPHKLDGMGSFAAGPDRVALVRNHELKPRDLEIGAFGPDRSLASRLAADRIYDFAEDGPPVGGGTTTLIYDLKARRLVSDHLSLTGTLANCSGGVTPWGSWLSCEETTQGKGMEAGKDHGWVFEIPAAGKGLADPVPLASLGRFRHEAAAIDPRTGVVYLTEDEGDGRGLFYRLLPNDRTRLAAGGRLQALALPEGADADPRNGESRYWRAGDWRAAHWIDLDGLDNPYEDLRFRGRGLGAAWFSRGEGICYGDGEFYFTCTSGGPNGYGQIMRYRPGAAEGQPGETDAPGRLQLFCEPEDPRVMEMCDNLAVAPWGHLIVCEDKVGGDNYLRAVTPEGRVYTLGRHPGGSELAGACFSPDGTTLFLNIYMPGTTLAITGPWSRLRA